MTIKDKLDKKNYTQSSVLDNSKSCELILRTPEGENEDQEIVMELINTILMEVDSYKRDQLDILEINFNHTAKYKDKDYRVIDLINLKESYKTKLDILESFSQILKDDQKVSIQLSMRVTISNLRKEYQELNKILNYFNMRTQV
jgi:hypothetical protein